MEVEIKISAKSLIGTSIIYAGVVEVTSAEINDFVIAIQKALNSITVKRMKNENTQLTLKGL